MSQKYNVKLIHIWLRNSLWTVFRSPQWRNHNEAHTTVWGNPIANDSDVEHKPMPDAIIPAGEDSNMQSNAISCKNWAQLSHTGSPWWSLIKATTPEVFFSHLCCEGLLERSKNLWRKRQTDLLGQTGLWCCLMDDSRDESSVVVVVT